VVKLAVVLSAEDLKTKVSTPIPTNTLSQINEVLKTADMLLKNPVVQNVIYRFTSRFGNPISTTQTNPTSKLNSESVYTMLLSTITSIMNVAGDIPLSQVKDYLVNNKPTVLSLIEKALSGENVKPKLNEQKDNNSGNTRNG